MADAERKSDNGKSRIDFQTDPSQYRHWKLERRRRRRDAARWTSTRRAALFEGYELKLNSYDLGVDIELADAIERLRFEHPAGARSILLRSGKQRVFCAGANIRMLAGATHAHKVNFCKFTNETRNGIEDASEYSGLKTICVINGTAAGGGYELALAADHIMLVDDGSSAVSLPELPLLAVLPGTGGLTRVTDKRKVRRDHADVFCTTEEGIKGKRAVDWRLVDEVVPGSKLEETVAKRAQGIRRRSPAGRRGAKGITLTPLERERSADAVEYSTVVGRVRARGAARHHHAARARGAAACVRRRHGRAGRRVLAAAAGARARRRHPRHPRSTSSTSRRSCSSRAGDPAAGARLRRFLDANNGSLARARDPGLWKRVLKRVDLTSRSLVALIEPGSCFAGTLAELVFATDRSYMLIGQLRRRQQAAGDDRAWPRSNFGAYPMSNGLSRLASRFLADPADVDKAKAEIGKMLDAEDARAAWARHLRARRHRLGGRDPRVPGGARELFARRAHRAGSQPALRRPGDHGNRKSSPASPPGRTGSSSARTRSARRARSSATAPGRSRCSIREECEEDSHD